MTDEVSRQTDEELVRLVQSGRAEVFNLIVGRYEKKMENYAHHFLCDKDDISDLLQEIFIKVYKNIKSFDATRKFSPWIYRIAHNEFVNALKRNHKKALPLFDSDVLFPQGKIKPVFPEADREDQKRTVNKFLDGLEMKYREPLMLYYIEELSYKEIADVLRIPVTTVGVRIKRAKDAVKKKTCKEALGPDY
jgi:RNA polymerase sigma-70 factor, ECF subfamily